MSTAASHWTETVACPGPGAGLVASGTERCAECD
jgi:hypothetical protein